MNISFAKLKKLILFSFILSITITIISIQRIDKFNYPQPTRLHTKLKDKDESDVHVKRKEWIDMMHRTAEGVNWRSKDEKFRLQRSNQLYKNGFKNTPIDGLWREVGSKNQAGRIHLAEIDPSGNYIYCASSGGNLWKSPIDNISWENLNDNFRIPGIHFIKFEENNNQNRLLLASSEWNVSGFYYSDNDGSSWNQASGLSNIENWGYIKKAVLVNNNTPYIFLLVREWDYDKWEDRSSIYVSVNLGESFQRLKSYNNVDIGHFDIWADNQEADHVVLAQNDSLQHIDIHGNISTICNNIQISTQGNYYLSGHHSSNNNTIYLLVNQNGVSDIYQSTNNGVDWNFKGTADTNPFMTNSFSCSAKNPNVLYLGGVDCYKSYDAGVNWTKVNAWGEYYQNPEFKLHADICGINSFLDEDGDEFVLSSTDGGIYISHDSLESNQNLSLNNLNVSQYYSTYTCRFNTNISHAGSQDQGYQKAVTSAQSGPINFDQVISGDYGHIVSGDDGASIWMVYPGFAAYYPDINNNNGLYTWSFTCEGQAWIPPLMPDPDNANKVYLGGGGNNEEDHIYELTYQSGSITATERSFNFESSIGAIAYSSIQNSYWYVINSNGDFFFSTDNGYNWTKTSGFTGPSASYLYGSDILVSNKQLGRLYVAGSGYSNPGVYKSENHGASFTPISNGLPSTMVYQIAQDEEEKYIFAATEVGPYVYIVEDGQWYDLSAGNAPDQVYWSVDYIPALKTARFGTYGRGIWDFVINSNVSIDEEEIEDEIINIFPNPSNGEFNIEVNAGNIKFIRLEVFNSNGQNVFAKDYENYASVFKTSIDISRQSKGMYFLNIVLGSKKITKKLIIQ